jgi:hypothetical protein
LLSRFSLYDFIAVLIPGIFFIWVLQTIIPSAGLVRAVPFTGQLSETSILIVIGYVVGLLLQGASQLVTETILLRWWGGFPSARWLRPHDTRFSPSYRSELAEALDRHFAIKLPEGGKELDRSTLKRRQEIFYRCYRSVEKLSDLPQTFVAEYGLFRSLLTTFLILAAIASANILISLARAGTAEKRDISILVGVLGGALITYLRTVQRSNDFAKSVFDVFLVNFGTRPGSK